MCHNLKTAYTGGWGDAMLSSIKQKKNPTILSLFSGCGGMDLGFSQAGFQTLWANDIEKLGNYVA